MCNFGEDLEETVKLEFVPSLGKLKNIYIVTSISKCANATGLFATFLLPLSRSHSVDPLLVLLTYQAIL